MDECESHGLLLKIGSLQSAIEIRGLMTLYCWDTLPETNIAHENPIFLVNTIKMVDFPWLC